MQLVVHENAVLVARMQLQSSFNSRSIVTALKFSSKEESKSHLKTAVVLETYTQTVYYIHIYIYE